MPTIRLWHTTWGDPALTDPHMMARKSTRGRRSPHRHDPAPLTRGDRRVGLCANGIRSLLLPLTTLNNPIIPGSQVSYSLTLRGDGYYRWCALTPGPSPSGRGEKRHWF